MSRPNILLLAVDSLRADHLGCYGYGKNTSPHIDALARESLVFDRAFAAGIPTVPSFTTLFSGLHPLRHGVTAHAGEQRLSEDMVLLPQLAKRAGYVTAGIDNLVVQGGGRNSWFARGFDFYSGFLFEPFSDQSERLTTRALRFMDDFRDKPFLLYLHLWDPHTPYGPPKPYDILHYERNAHGTSKLNEVKALAPEYYEAFLADMKLRVPNDYDYVVAQYDGEISYVDTQIGRIVAHLKASGLWDNTIVILMSDHGECFGEGDVYFDHHGLYDAVTRIALMCRLPGVAPARTDAMVSTEDVLPTLIECGNCDAPEYELTGRSFAPALRGGNFAGRDFVISTESTRQASICLRTDRWKLIQPVTHDARGEPLPDIYGNARDPKTQLFDLQNDAAETRDISDRFPDVRDGLLRQLNECHRMEVVRRGGHDPMRDGLGLPYNEFMQRLTSRKMRG